MAYYEIPPMDGSGNGTFYVRMDILEDVPVFDMPTLAYHEAYPGHHLQLATHLESKSIPMYRKRFYNNGYIEGWAMYVERLMYEEGMYEDDPHANIGRLKAELFRAARMITDIGIHHKKWSRENAVLFLGKHSTLNKKHIESEVDRYTVDPAQGCSYTVGFQKMLALRDKAKNALGEQFDLKEYHDVVLEQGVVPLFVLEEMVDEYIQDKKDNND